MYANSQMQERIHDMPLQIKSEETMRAAKKSGRGNPYEGAPLQVSGKLSNHIKQSFGINANELAIRESPEVAQMGARATAQGNAIRFAPGEFKPDTREGMEVLGHELNHVREQATGGVHAPAGELFEHPRHEAASDKAGEAFAGGSLSAAAPVSVGGMSAGAAPVQGLFGSNKKKRYAEALRSSAAIFNSRGDSAREGMTAALEEQGKPVTNEALDFNKQSRFIQGFSTSADTPEYKKQMASVMMGRGSGGANNFSDEAKADPVFIQQLRGLVQPHIDRVLAFDMSSINLDDPESLAAHLPEITRFATFNQAFGDLKTSVKLKDLGGSEQIHNEVGERLGFMNVAYTNAIAKLGKATGFQDDASLYAKADYDKALGRYDKKVGFVSASRPGEGAFQSKEAREKMTLRANNMRNTRAQGAKTFAEFQQKTGTATYVPPAPAPAPEPTPERASFLNTPTRGGSVTNAIQSHMQDAQGQGSGLDERMIRDYVSGLNEYQGKGETAAPAKKKPWYKRLFGG